MSDRDPFEELEQQHLQAMKKQAEEAATLMRGRIQAVCDEVVTKFISVFEAEAEDKNVLAIGPLERELLEDMGRSIFFEATERMAQNTLRSGQMTLDALEGLRND